jgi:hypothetical protein
LTNLQSWAFSTGCVFQRGFAGIRDVFTHIKNIRKWGAQDRISETHVVEYWRENLLIDGEIPLSLLRLNYSSEVKRLPEEMHSILLTTKFVFLVDE